MLKEETEKGLSVRKNLGSLFTDLNNHGGHGDHGDSQTGFMISSPVLPVVEKWEVNF